MNRDGIIEKLNSEIKEVSDVKTIVIQELLWEGFLEVRCFTKNAGYTALYQSKDGVCLDVSDFKELPKENK